MAMLDAHALLGIARGMSQFTNTNTFNLDVIIVISRTYNCASLNTMVALCLNMMNHQLTSSDSSAMFRPTALVICKTQKQLFPFLYEPQIEI